MKDDNMRFSSKMLIIICSLIAAVNLNATEILTNHVAIENRGMHLSLTDVNLEETHTQEMLLKERELHAEARISWILHNTSSNDASVIFLGMTNSFDFKLFDEKGVEISKTTKGRSMSVGPIAPADLYKNKYLRRIGGESYGMAIMDFPKLTDLFNIRSSGIYTLEVRYWEWASAKKAFILSDPIRVHVIKEEEPKAP
jgi:hypothetical protein